MSIDPTACTPQQFFHESLYRPPFEWISPMVGIFAAIALICSFVYIYGRDKGTQEQKQQRTHVSKVIIGAWTLLPPLWFMFEYWWLLGYLHLGRDHCIETLTTRQDLASKFWVAAVLMLVAVYKKDVPELG